MEINYPITLICKIIDMDQSSFSYKACSVCETALPETPGSVCNNENCNGRRYPYKRLFRLLFSIETDTMGFKVICFDRAANVIFGCSAQEFFEFAMQHPFAAKNARNALVGEMFKITLKEPKRAKAEHRRMTNVVPLRTDFQPVIKSLEKLYQELYGDIADA
ncbi:hypothetical protein REPUB_Repub05bG0198500 [Reevesia pubescens]